MRYGYVRVSSADQNLTRQRVAIKAYAPDLSDGNIFAEKVSGKNFDRPEYQRMKGVLCRGDEVIIKDLDRLGRNKDGIKAELQWFREHGVTARVLNVPTTLIDFQGQDWIADMVNNILIEVMGAIAEHEREEIRQRQREGIDAMPIVDGKRVSTRTGKAAGRPPKEIDIEKYKNLVGFGKITVSMACAALGISRTQWYRVAKGVA